MATGWRVFGAVVAVVAGGFAVDEAVWLGRGSPAGSVAVSVVTVMEFKSGKEDYGTPETSEVRCGRRVLPGFDALPPCWWVERQSQVVRRP